MAPPSPPPTSTYMHQALHTTPTLTNLLLSSSNLVRSPYMHKVPQAVQFRYAALTFILAPGYVQIITLEASQPRDRLTSAAFRSVTSVIIFCLVPSMKTFTAGVSKGGVQKFNGHLYWFSWQVNNSQPSHSFQKTFIFSAQDNDANVKNAKWDWFNARNYCRCISSHPFA